MQQFRTDDLTGSSASAAAQPRPGGGVGSDGWWVQRWRDEVGIHRYQSLLSTLGSISSIHSSTCDNASASHGAASTASHGPLLTVSTCIVTSDGSAQPCRLSGANSALY